MKNQPTLSLTKHIFTRTAVTLLATLSTVWTVPGIAEEGFKDSTTLPKEFKPAWNATYFARTVVSRGFETGAAVVVGKKKGKEFDTIFLLTNNHVVSGCTKGIPCEKSIVSKNVLIAPDKNGKRKIEQDGKMGMLTVVASSTIPDLALIKLQTMQDTADIKPLQFSSQCEALKSADRLFAIGFPSTHHRTYPNALAIDSKEKTFKRWSAGYYLSQIREFNNGRLEVLERTTVDSLRGNSGGPVLNEKGEWVGIVNYINSDESKGFAYMGVEKYEWQWPHSFFIPCGIAKEFLKENGL